MRHADAFDGGADDARALTPRGFRQAALVASTLERIGARAGLLLTSPRLRAVQTAELLRLDGPAPVVVEALGQGDAEATAHAFADATAHGFAEAHPGSGVVVAVGHEPWLSELTALLVTGDPHGAAIGFGKATLATLEGRPAPGGMRLTSLTPLDLAGALLGRHADDAA